MMIVADENVSRTEMTNNPGWVKVRNKTNSSIYYVSPDGRQVSRREYDDLFRKYQSNIPASAIRGMTTPDAIKNMTSGFISDVATRPSEHPEHKTPPPPTQATVESSIAYQQQQQSQAQSEQTAWENVVQIADAIPDPKKPSGRATVNNPSPNDVAMGMASILIFITIGIALLVKIPEVQMTEQQAANIVIPFYNIAKKHGWLNAGTSKMLAEGDDWAQLGAGLVMYFSVVIPAVQARVNLMNAEATYRRAQAGIMTGQQDIPHQRQPAAASTGTNGYQASNQSAFMPASNMIKPPPGVQP